MNEIPKFQYVQRLLRIEIWFASSIGQWKKFWRKARFKNYGRKLIQLKLNRRPKFNFNPDKILGIC